GVKSFKVKCRKSLRSCMDSHSRRSAVQTFRLWTLRPEIHYSFPDKLYRGRRESLAASCLVRTAGTPPIPFAFSSRSLIQHQDGCGLGFCVVLRCHPCIELEAGIEKRRAA